MAAIYPVGPKCVPSDFTEPSTGYCGRVALLLLSLTVAFAVYAALLAGTGWLAYKFASPATAKRRVGSMRRR
jgi:hypothetical protein